MKIWRCLQPERIFLNVLLTDKDAVLRFAVDAFARGRVVENAFQLYEGMRLREQVMSTGIGYGIGIPHTISSEAKEVAVLLIRLARPIDFAALDASPVDVIMPMVVPENATLMHLQVLAGTSKLCRNPEFLKTVRRAMDPMNLLEEIRSLEEEAAFR